MRRVLLPHHITEYPAPIDGVIVACDGVSMGTTWSVRLVAPDAAAQQRLQQGLQQQLDRIVAQMSHWQADSELARFNGAPAGSWHTLAPAFFDVLSFALDVARDSGGAYDPAAGALVNLWGFGPTQRFDEAGFRAPDEAAVAALLVRRATLDVDVRTRRVRQPGGLLLDLSSVAKGYAVDSLSRYLERNHIIHYLVEVGGELRGAGVKPDGQPWWVALEPVGDVAPVAPDYRVGAVAPAPDEMVLALHGLAVATSGDYRRYFTRDGRRFSHTIDPRSGQPIRHGLASVTVVHAECMAADAWSTALTVLGPEHGLALAERRGLAARFLLRDGDGARELLSSALRRMLDA